MIENEWRIIEKRRKKKRRGERGDYKGEWETGEEKHNRKVPGWVPK